MTETVAGHAIEVVAIAWAEAQLAARKDVALWSDEERRYAFSKSDPARRLAARWAAKIAAARVLGGATRPEEIEVVRTGGAPRLRLHAGAEARHRALGGGPLHVSLTHGLTHAAASVVLEVAER